MANAGSLRGTANDLADRLSEVADINPSLAADIRRFLASREYGLVFEHNRPEAMRLLGKRVKKGDVVHVLPPRGQRETKANRVEWRVQSIDGETVELLPIGRRRKGRTAPLDDVAAVAAYTQPIYPGLREVDRVERKGSAPYHMVINGENFHVLESLLFSFAGKVDCIYIDPPYNSGAKDWKYNNDYVNGTDAYKHSKWLAFMERRLRIAKRLLNPRNSVLIVTIDEREYHRLGLLLEQVFPGSRIQMVTSIIKPEGTQKRREFSRTNEYIFFVMCGDESVVRPYRSDMTSDGEYEPNEPGTLAYQNFRRDDEGDRRGARPNQFYPVFVDEGTGRIVSVGDPMGDGERREDVGAPPGQVAVFPLRDSGEEMIWKRTPEALRSTAERGFAFGEKDRGVWKIKYLSSDIIGAIDSGEIEVTGRDERGRVTGFYPDGKKTMPKTVWSKPSHNPREHGTKILGPLFGGQKRFNYPKSLYAVADALRIFLKNKPDAVVLDYFAGSATTLHATCLLNAEDGGNRRCICVTNNEISLSESQELTSRGLRQGDREWEDLGIAHYVAWPRVKSAISGVDVNGEPIGKDRRYLGLDRSLRDGFDENAIFFDLTYQDPVMVDLDQAFAEIAPLLWIRAGCKGPIIADRGNGTFKLAGTYGVLFDFAHVRDFVDAVRKDPSIGTAFVVTDDMGRYQEVCRLLRGLDVVHLYEDYLRTFEIAPEGI